MAPLDHLATVAEIAIALAGFSALVAIIGSKDDAEAEPEAFRLQLMLEASLFVVALSLVPIVLFELGVSESGTWRAAAIVFLLVDVAINVAVWVRARKHVGYFDRITTYAVTAMGYSGDAAVALILLGVHSIPASGLYLLAIYLNLVLAGLIFIRFAATNFGRLS